MMRGVLICVMESLILALLLALVAWLVLVGVAPAQAAPQDSAIRIPSHGLSGVTIWTERDRSLFLSAAHGFKGPSRTKPIILDIQHPANYPMPPKRGPIRLLQVDYNLDLVLIELPAGPLPYYSPVAPVAHRGVSIRSVGFDRMQLPVVSVETQVVGSDGPRQYTVNRPVEGRSGGPLLDVAANLTLGTVIGYEAIPRGRGIYTSTQALWRFLDGYNAGGQPRRASEVFPLPGHPQIDRPWVSEHRQEACPT